MKAGKIVRNPVDEAHRLSRSGDLTGALGVLETARATAPFDADILLSIADIADRIGMRDAAETCLREALAVAPGEARAAAHLGRILSDSGRTEEAIALLRAATMAAPERPELWLALANVMRALSRWDEAEHFFAEALRLKPGSIAARAGLADIRFDRGDVGTAIEDYTSALKLAPKNAQLRFNRAVACLHLGQTANGWRDYEWRLKLDGQEIERRLGGGARLRRWDGGPLRGKGLVICGEQGIGDQIFFASGLAAARELGGDGAYFAEADERLLPLLRRSFTDIHFHPFTPQRQDGTIRADYDWTQTANPAKLFIELASLPLLQEKAGAPFPAVALKTDADEASLWRGWLQATGPRPKIGLCWRSGKTGGLRPVHFASPEHWAAFIGGIDADFVSLQYDPLPGEIKHLAAAAGRPVHEPPGLDQRHEIDRLAALTGELDMVVSAPTAVAALAAAVNVTTLKITALGSWTGLGKPVEPFRPSARIIQPRALGDWPDAFRAAAAIVRERIAGL